MVRLSYDLCCIWPRFLQELVSVFYHPYSNSNEIASAGDQIFLSMYRGKRDDTLGKLSY